MEYSTDSNMIFTGGIVPEHIHLAISDNENKGHILLFFPAFLLDRHLRVKTHICKKRRLSNSERKREREREGGKKVLAAPHYNQLNL